MKIILDTNFLIYCAKQKIDYAEEIRILIPGKYELVVLSQVIKELKDLEAKAKKYSDREAASLALRLLKLNKVKTTRGKGKLADDAIVKESRGNIIATVDLALARRVEKSIVIKARKRLVLR